MPRISNWRAKKSIIIAGGNSKRSQIRICWEIAHITKSICVSKWQIAENTHLYTLLELCIVMYIFTIPNSCINCSKQNCLWTPSVQINFVYDVVKSKPTEDILSYLMVRRLTFSLKKNPKSFIRTHAQA